ncbi:BQ2448_7189 [Microbotryum intermedium]|uniref:BQ2448_7189 protein n=1 Tax=Microbotryum intermedium TaxID=269621 RepID=A0A238FMZ7_9BASI|nr:BQ2448_7189 [Microbotryum intermedium]
MPRTSTRIKATPSAIDGGLNTSTNKMSPLKFDLSLPTALSTPKRVTRSNASRCVVKDEQVKHEEAFTTPIQTQHVKKGVIDAFDVETPQGLSPSSVKKLAILDKMLGVSPYPDLMRPTPEECEDVYVRLCQGHGVPIRPKVVEDRPNAVAGCGQTPDVLDALIRTTLSQNTRSLNSTNAKNAMDRVYGRAEHRKVLQGGEGRLEQTIRCGGLAKVKAKSIIKILTRLDQRQGGQGQLSLDYLHAMSDKEAMKELCSFDLIGVKTASCVLLFCLGRESFAVDTHVHRITQFLNWVPPSASRDETFFHLDVRIPDQLKYGLHSLLVRHGRGCEKCSAKGVTSMDFIAWCPLKGLIGGRGKGKGNKGDKMGDEEDGDVVVKVEDEKEVVETRVEGIEGVEGVANETTRVRPRRRATSGRKVKDERGSESEVEGEKEVVKKRKVKVARKVEDDEREMSGVRPSVAAEMSKSLQDGGLQVRGVELH